MRIQPCAVAAVSASWLALAAMATTADSAAGVVDPHDLEGTWMYATMTPLERPREFAGKPG